MILLLVCAGISIYGSWIPFHFVSRSISEALADFSENTFFTLSVGSRSDWAANMLLFLPIGFLGTGIYQLDRREPSWLWIVPVFLATAFSCAGGAALEFSQEWLPDRVPSANDICAQTVGAFWGSLAWTACGQQLVDWARRWSATLDSDQRLNNVLLLGVATHVLSLALPLDLTIRPSDLWHKYKAGRIGLLPLQSLVPETPGEWFELTFLVGGSALAGWLMLRLQSRQGRSRVSLWLQLVFGGLAFCSLLEFMQLLVYSRASKVDDIILGTLGFLAGALLLPQCAREDGAGPPGRLRYLKSMLLATYLAWLFLFYWWPGDLTLNPESLLQRSGHFFRVPFTALYAGSYGSASAEILRKTSLFATLAILTASVLEEFQVQRLSHRTVILASVTISLAAGILIEVGQIALPTRTADVTDVLLYGTGAGGGALLAAYLQGARAAKGSQDLLDDA